jgi:hypothetical protein
MGCLDPKPTDPVSRWRQRAEQTRRGNAGGAEPATNPLAHNKCTIRRMVPWQFFDHKLGIRNTAKTYIVLQLRHSMRSLTDIAL